jgi:hypothetical protein
MRPGGRVSFLSIGAGSSLRGELDKLPRHPDALMLPTVAADTAANVGGVGAVLEVVPAGRSQCGFNRRRPLVVSLGQPQTWLGVRPRSRSTAGNGLRA